MTKFNVLGTMRAIRDDKSLSTTQAHLLMCAVLRTDNDTCKVRYSIEGLAKDANVSDKTARTAFKAPEVLKYMYKVEGLTRAKNMWFHPIPVIDAIPVTDASIPVTDDTDSGNGYRPSTLSSASSSTKVTTSAEAPVVDSLPNYVVKEEAKEEDVVIPLTTREQERGVAAASVYKTEDELRERRRRMGLA